MLFFESGERRMSKLLLFFDLSLGCTLDTVTRLRNAFEGTTGGHPRLLERGIETLPMAVAFAVGDRWILRSSNNGNKEHWDDTMAKLWRGLWTCFSGTTGGIVIPFPPRYSRSSGLLIPGTVKRSRYPSWVYVLRAIVQSLLVISPLHNQNIKYGNWGYIKLYFV